MAHSEVMDPYKTIVDRYDGTVYSNMIVVVLDGSPRTTVTSATLPRSNGSSTRTGTPPLLTLKIRSIFARGVAQVSFDVRY